MTLLDIAIGLIQGLALLVGIMLTVTVMGWSWQADPVLGMVVTAFVFVTFHGWASNR